MAPSAPQRSPSRCCARCRTSPACCGHKPPQGGDFLPKDDGAQGIAAFRSFFRVVSCRRPRCLAKSGTARARFREPNRRPPSDMDIYLPIAEVSLDVFVLLGLGAAVGFLSGVFGVGGGFLLTPLLIFIGVPATRRGRVLRQPAGRRLIVRRHRALAAGQCRFQDGICPAGRRPRRLGVWRLAVHLAEAARTNRADDLGLLRRSARHAGRS